MVRVFPDLSLALAINPVGHRSPGGPATTPGAATSVVEAADVSIARFLWMLRDHDAFAMTTMGVLVNRWGVLDPPEQQLFPRLWLMNFLGHINGGTPKKLEDTLAAYLGLASSLGGTGFSMTEWIFRKWPRKRVLWVVRAGKNEKFSWKFMWKDYIVLVRVPGDEATAGCTKRSAAWELLHEDNDGLRFLAGPKKEWPRPKVKPPAANGDDAWQKFVFAMEHWPISDVSTTVPPDLSHQAGVVRTLLQKHSVVPDWTDIVYIPSSGEVRSTDGNGGTQPFVEGSGGLILIERRLDSGADLTSPSFRELLDRVKYIHSAVQQVYAAFVREDNGRVQGYFAQRSAQSAIMARNMSHNIGSHALARIHAETLTGPPGANRAGGPKDAERLLQYMQERMDFVARVATEWPTWREPVLFYADLMRGFLKQGLLLDNLIADDGFPASSITFQLQGPFDSDWVEAKWKACDPKAAAEDKQYSEFQFQSKEDSGPQDFLVAIPGGPVGRQAFYGFLENAIRNAAKHNSGAALEVSLKVEDDGRNGKRFYLLRYQDNLSPGETMDKVQAHLETALVDETGRTVSEGWGIQEMKVYARFLAHPHEDWVAPDSPERLPGPLGATAAGPLHSSGSRPRLTYAFGLQRPCLALVPKSMVGATEDKVLAPYGVECYDGTPWAETDSAFRKLVRASSPGLLYLMAPQAQEELTGLLNWLKANRLWLPARILLRPANGEAKQANGKAKQLFEELKEAGLAHRVRVDYEIKPLSDILAGNNAAETGARVVIELYRRWLAALAGERGHKPPFRLVVYFDRDNSTFAERWASLKDPVGAHGVHADEFLVVYPVCKQPVQDGTLPPVTLSPWKPVARRYCKENQNNYRFGALEIRSEQQTGTWLLFDNHGNGRPTGLTEGSEAFYQHLGNIQDLQNNREAFERLADVPQGFAGVLFLLQLVESCLLKVLVLDERVAQTVLEVEESNLYLVKQSWYRRWYWAGLRLAPLFHWKGNSLCHVGKAANVESFRGGELDGLGITFDGGQNPRITRCSEQPTSCVVIGKDGWPEEVALDKAAPFDAVVIHRGLLETLAGQVGAERAEDFEKRFLDALHALGARVLVTSGRGAQLEGPCGDYPFVEYSILEATVVRELSKPSLGSVLMATIGR